MGMQRNYVQKGVKGFVVRPLAERFWEKVTIAGPDECWPWTASTRSGYGVFSINGTRRPAPQVAWELRHGEPFPEAMRACHTCDNPPCCNPAHIWPGTQQDNIRDAVAKGRIDPKRGPRITHCKRGHELTPENRYTRPGGRYQCRTCWQASNDRSNARRRERRRADIEVAFAAPKDSG